MAKTDVFFIFIFLMASISYISCILPFLSVPIGEGTIYGVLTCSLNGNPRAPPISGAVVTLVCANATTDVAQAVTDPRGVFTILLKFTDTIVYDPSTCFVEANIPPGSCQLYAPDGVATATVNLINFGILGTLGFVNYTTGVFRSAIL